MKALEAKGIYHIYKEGGSAVLDNFSLSLDEGEFVALMGPSGSGKSTFLHLAAGLLTPKAGTLLVNDTNVATLSDSAAARFRRQHEGIVFQSFNLLESLTVAENIVLPAKLNHQRANAQRVTELLSRVGLSGFDRRHPAELSGGEQQRVAIARALYAHPGILLADEPTGNLDTQSSHAICETLQQVNAAEKCAILLVTHDPVVAAFASRVCFLKDGALADSFSTQNDATLISKKYLECYG